MMKTTLAHQARELKRATVNAELRGGGRDLEMRRCVNNVIRSIRGGQMGQTCSLKEVQEFGRKLTQNVDANDPNLQRIIAQMKRYNGRAGMTGGGKYSPATIHAITTMLLLGGGVASIGAAMYAMEASGLATVWRTYQGVSDVALRGCGNWAGVTVRQGLAAWVNPALSCSFNTAAVEKANSQILIILQWIAAGIGLVDLASGKRGYSAVYDRVEQFLQKNDPPCPMMTRAPGTPLEEDVDLDGMESSSETAEDVDLDGRSDTMYDVDLDVMGSSSMRGGAHN